MAVRGQVVGLLLSLSFWLSEAVACPLCGSPQKTFSEDFAAADAVVLAQWSDGKAPAGMLVGKTTFSIVDVARGGSDALKKDAKLAVPKFHAGQRGDLFLLFGEKEDGELLWRPLEITEAGYQYLKQAPASDEPTAKRLEYFVQFLEFPDDRISMDAYWEFANAPWEDIVKVKPKLDRVKLRQWVNDERAVPMRLNLYFLLLGLCGNQDDAKELENLVRVPPLGVHSGRDGLMSGYLLLTGDEGLKVLDETKLTNPRALQGEVYAAMQALEFFWTYGSGRISKDRLRRSMRPLIDDPDLSDRAIANLSRWEDWSVQDRVLRRFDGANLATRRAVVSYFLVAAKPKLNGPAIPDSAKQARENLEKLRRQEPKYVRQIERSFVP